MSLAPWSDLLAAAARMGIAPQVFWGISVREWRLIATGASGVAAMGRAQLNELVLKFPDQGAGDDGKK